MVVVIMGVSGSGKTTMGKRFAKRMGWSFLDADDFHPSENVKKMRVGIPLTDEDRMPWLRKLAEIIQSHNDQKSNLVLACSAFKKPYRRILRVDQKTVRTVFLKGTPTVLKERLRTRRHRYMTPALLDSQLEALEEPEDGLILNIERSPRELVREIAAWIEK